MPALITHHLFGEEAARLLPKDLLACEEEMVAFLLGNQGPDPLFFRFRACPRVNAHMHQLALRMHGTPFSRRESPYSICMRGTRGSPVPLPWDS